MALRAYMLEINFRTMGFVNMSEFSTYGKLEYVETWFRIVVPLPLDPTKKMPRMILKKDADAELRTSCVALKSGDPINVHDHAIPVNPTIIASDLMVNLYPIPVISNDMYKKCCPADWTLPSQTDVSGFNTHTLDDCNYNGRDFVRPAVLKAGEDPKLFGDLDEDTLLLAGFYQGEAPFKESMRHAINYLKFETLSMITALNKPKEPIPLRCPKPTLNPLAIIVGLTVKKMVTFVVHPDKGILYSGSKLSASEKTAFVEAFRRTVDEFISRLKL